MKRKIVLVLLIAALGIAGLLVFRSRTVTRQPMVRLMDHFNQLQITGNASSEHNADLQKFIANKISKDHINGSTVHPLRLKITKPRLGPSQGIGLRTENVILAPPTTVFEFSQQLGAHPVLDVGYGLASDEWEQSKGTATFKVFIQDPESGRRKAVFGGQLNAELPKDRGWHKHRVDLQPFAKQPVKIIFETTQPESNPLKSAYAVWINPVLSENSGVPRRPNLILISIDTLRADHLSCYGYKRATSPLIDQIAQRGVRFNNAIAQAPYTMSSHMSLLTSLYPSFHGVNKLRESYLDSAITTLAETLYNESYRTWAITGGGQLGADYGFAEGFETFTEYTHRLDVEKKVKEATEFMENAKNENFFLFFHTFRAHAPYKAPAPYDTMFDSTYTGNISGQINTINDINDGKIAITERDVQHLIALYDGEIRQTNDALVPFMDHLNTSGLDKNTLVVITSDHGEEFGEHGKVALHSHTLYDELLKIPFIIRGPGIPEGKVIEDQVRSIDIAPTILHLLGIKKSDGMQGTSLVNLMNTGKASADVFAYSERLPTDNIYLRSVRSSGSKFIYEDSQEVKKQNFYYYDLRKDPGERKNVFVPASGSKMMTQIQFLIDKEKNSKKTVRQKDLDPETLETLKALGYIN